MRIGQTSLIYLLSKSLGSVLGFIATIYFARVLGEEVLGQYALTLTVVLWLGIVGHVGINKATTKRISEGEEPRSYAGASLLIMGVMMTLVSLLVVIFRSEVNSYIGAPVAEFVILLLFVSLYKSFINSALKGVHKVHIYALLSTAKEGVQAAAQVILVLFGLGLAGMLWGYAIGYFIIATTGILILGLRPSVPGKKHLLSLLEYARYAWLGSMRSKSFNTVDVAVLGFFVSQGLVGIYSVAWGVGKFLDIFGSAISNSLFPEMSRQSINDGTNAVSKLTEDAMSFAGLFLIPGLIGATVIGDRLMAIYGSGFVQGYQVLTLLTAALLVYTYNQQLLNTLNAIDRPDLAFRSNGVFILANLLLNFLLVYLYGWIGAAVATALSAAVGLVFAFYYTRRLIDFTVPYGEIGRQWVAALLMGGVVYGARAVGEETALATYNEVFVVLLVTLGAGVYFLTYLAISTTFRDTVRRNLPVDVPGL